MSTYIIPPATWENSYILDQPFPSLSTAWRIQRASILLHSPMCLCIPGSSSGRTVICVAENIFDFMLLTAAPLPIHTAQFVRVAHHHTTRGDTVPPRPPAHPRDPSIMRTGCAQYLFVRSHLLPMVHSHTMEGG